MKISDDFYFKRKTFVKDLLSISSLLKDTAMLSFQSFETFATTVLRDNAIDLSLVSSIKVPVEDEEQMSLLLKIRPEVRPFLYIEVLSPKAMKTYKDVKGAALYSSYSDVLSIRDAVKDYGVKLENPCVYSLHVDRDNILNLAEIAAVPFLQWPQFCVIDFRFDYESLIDMSLGDLDKIQWVSNFLKFNLYGREEAINTADGRRISYRLSPFYSAYAKRLYISSLGYMGFMYQDKGLRHFINIYETFDCYEKKGTVIDCFRAPYDCKFSERCGVSNKAFIDIFQNERIMGNPAMIPECCKMIATMFDIDRK